MKSTSKSAPKAPSGKLDILRMQTEVGLTDSMTRSKMLTVFIVAGILLFSGFVYFLYKMAGA